MRIRRRDVSFCDNGALKWTNCSLTDSFPKCFHSYNKPFTLYAWSTFYYIESSCFVAKGVFCFRARLARSPLFCVCILSFGLNLGRVHSTAASPLLSSRRRRRRPPRTCPARNISLMKGLELENVLRRHRRSPTDRTRYIFHLSLLSPLSSFRHCPPSFLRMWMGYHMMPGAADSRTAGAPEAEVTSKLGILKMARVGQHERSKYHYDE